MQPFDDIEQHLPQPLPPACKALFARFALILTMACKNTGCWASTTATTWARWSMACRPGAACRTWWWAASTGSRSPAWPAATTRRGTSAPSGWPAAFWLAPAAMACACVWTRKTAFRFGAVGWTTAAWARWPAVLTPSRPQARCAMVRKAVALWRQPALAGRGPHAPHVPMHLAGRALMPPGPPRPVRRQAGRPCAACVARQAARWAQAAPPRKSRRFVCAACIPIYGACRAKRPLC